MLETSRPSGTIQQQLDQGCEVCPFPQVVSRLLAALKDPKADSKTFAKIIETDVALATRLLRMANSPIYGLTREVRSIAHAITILGCESAKNLALSFAGMTMFSGDAQATKYRRALWDHSLGCATTARLLAEAVNIPNSDEAFLAGIFHDVGKLFLHKAIPDKYTPLSTAEFGDELVKREKQFYGISHDEVGLKLIITWPLPDDVKLAVRYHHEPENKTVDKLMPVLIHIADGLARATGIGSVADSRWVVFEDARKLLGLDTEAMCNIQDAAFKAFEETQKAYT